MKRNMLKNVEWWVLIVALILSTIGIVALFSATQESEYNEFKKQIIWLIVSIIIMIIIMLINYEKLIKVSPIIYGIFMMLLISVLFTEPINGARSWFGIGFMSFQPGEFAKIAVVLFLAYVISKFQTRGKDEINKPWKLLVSILVALFPIFLIIIQPDFGTAVTFLFILVAMLFVAGIKKQYIITALIVILISTPLIYQFILPAHAKARIDIFLNPESDARGAGYNVLQSKLAIGAGQLTGMGVLKGNQTQLGFLYPKTTDFIYSVIGEEMGFIVAGAIIILYVVLITKSIYVAKTSKDDVGAYIATGIAAIFLFHMIENIGMTMGLLPITGVPLLFVSYGGSSMITSYICIGLLLSISSKRQKAIFVK